MLTSFEIRNFRLFKTLGVDGLHRVNLFVGKNNSGKSALLEAIRVFAERASPRLLSELVRDRQESWSRPYGHRQFRSEGNPIRHLFYGHRFPLPDESGIVLEAGGDLHSTIKLHTGAFIREESDDGSVRRVRVSSSDFFGQPGPPELEYALILEEDGASRLLMDLDRGGVPFRRSPQRNGPTYPVQVIPTGCIEPSLIAGLWDRISLTEAEHTVLEALRLLDPDIEGIALVEDYATRKKERVAIIRTSEFDEPIPLSSLGDGLTRVFQLVLALVNAQGGALLIDEFENGLHWSVQKAVWEMVWRLAYSLEVQVFVSTHSRDCVRAFSEIWERSPGDGSFYRLERDSRGFANIRQYHSSALLDSISTGVEMR